MHKPIKYLEKAISIAANGGGKKQYRPKFRLALDLAFTGVPCESIYSSNMELVQGEVWTWEQTIGVRAS